MPSYKNKNLPTWFDPQKIADAAKSTFTKVASEATMKKEAVSNMVVLSYRDSKGHVISAEDPYIQEQVARKLSVLVDKWGEALVPHKQIRVWAKPDTKGISTVSDVTQIDPRERQLHPEYMVDSTINRHFQYKALQKLTDFANEMGMYGARARFLHAKNASTEGKQFQGFKEITAEISWLVGPRLKKNVTATITIDAGDKFVLPRTFKDASGQEHEFTKEAVASLLKGMQFEKPSREVRKRSDVPVYRKPDPTNFRAIPK